MQNQNDMQDEILALKKRLDSSLEQPRYLSSGQPIKAESKTREIPLESSSGFSEYSKREQERHAREELHKERANFLRGNQFASNEEPQTNGNNALKQRSSSPVASDETGYRQRDRTQERGVVKDYLSPEARGDDVRAHRLFSQSASAFLPNRDSLTKNRHFFDRDSPLRPIESEFQQKPLPEREKVQEDIER